MTWIKRAPRSPDGYYILFKNRVKLISIEKKKRKEAGEEEEKRKKVNPPM